MSYTVSKTFASTGASSTLPVDPSKLWSLTITGVFVATLSVELSDNNGVTWNPVAVYTSTLAASVFQAPPGKSVIYRVNCTAFTSGVPVITLSTDTAVILQRFGSAGTPVLTVDEGGLASPNIEGTPTGLIAYDPGSCAVNTLRVASDVVSAQTVTIGTEVYEIEIVNTDSTDVTAGGSFNTTAVVTVLAATYPHLLTVLGSLIKIGSEMLRLIGTGTYLTYSRGASGTTAATHADSTAIYIGDGVVATHIPVGLVTTLTPTAFTAALLADVNSQTAQAVTMTLVSVNELLLSSNVVGAVILATTETLAGANNAWSATAMYGGRAQAVRKFAIQKRVPKTLDVTLGSIKFVYDFTPTLVQVFVVVTATPGVAVAWDGAVTITLGQVVIDNTGTTDWDTTMTLLVIATN